MAVPDLSSWNFSRRCAACSAPKIEAVIVRSTMMAQIWVRDVYDWRYAMGEILSGIVGLFG